METKKGDLVSKMKDKIIQVSIEGLRKEGLRIIYGNLYSFQGQQEKSVGRIGAVR